MFWKLASQISVVIPDVLESVGLWRSQENSVISDSNVAIVDIITALFISCVVFGCLKIWRMCQFLPVK